MVMRERGFVFAGVMVALAVFAVGSMTFATYWSETVRRDREEELLRVGEEFVRAIRDYYENSPGTVKRFPPTLLVLMEDDRSIGVRRHLRRVYFDPVSGLDDWGVVRAPDGGIMGVHSLSEGEVLKRRNLPEFVQARGAAMRYRDWKFVYVPVP